MVYAAASEVSKVMGETGKTGSQNRRKETREKSITAEIAYSKTLMTRISNEIAWKRSGRKQTKKRKLRSTELCRELKLEDLTVSSLVASRCTLKRLEAQKRRQLTNIRKSLANTHQRDAFAWLGAEALNSSDLQSEDPGSLPNLEDVECYWSGLLSSEGVWNIQRWICDMKCVVEEVDT